MDARVTTKDAAKMKQNKDTKLHLDTGEASMTRTTRTTTTMSSSSKTIPTTEKKRVRWHSKVRLRVLTNNDTTPCYENEQIWYTSDDYSRFKADCRKDAEKARKYRQAVVDDRWHSDGCIDEGDDDYCTRGLEHMICRERGALKRIRRDKAMELVWNEQVRQWSNAVRSPEAIARAYKTVSERCQMDAHLQGIADQCTGTEFWQHLRNNHHPQNSTSYDKSESQENKQQTILTTKNTEGTPIVLSTQSSQSNFDKVNGSRNSRGISKKVTSTSRQPFARFAADSSRLPSRMAPCPSSVLDRGRNFLAPPQA